MTFWKGRNDKRAEQKRMFWKKGLLCILTGGYMPICVCVNTQTPKRMNFTTRKLVKSRWTPTRPGRLAEPWREKRTRQLHHFPCGVSNLSEVKVRAHVTKMIKCYDVDNYEIRWSCDKEIDGVLSEKKDAKTLQSPGKEPSETEESFL